MKKRRLIPLVVPFFVLVVGLRSVCGPVRAQNPGRDLLALINNARRAQGLYPYVVNAELTAAAQRHSDDMAASGQVSHSGSDGSSDTQRILEAGYGVYEFGPVVGENIYAGVGAAEGVFNTWIETLPARTNLLHEQYREVGLGVASDGAGRTFWTVTFGAQPNVLPVLVNDGAGSVDTVTVTLRLVPENAAPEGAGTAMGQPSEYRASTDDQFNAVSWQPWAERVTFVLDETPGQQTIYVQLRDAAGRTSISWVSVILTGLEITTTPTATAGTSPAPTATPTASATPAAQPTPTATPTRTPTPSTTPTAQPLPTATPTPTPTLTPTLLPTDAPTSVPSSTTTSAAPSEAASATRAPAPPGPPEVTVAPPPLPTQVIPGDAVEEEAEPSSLASRLAPWALGLQVVALILGVYLALRRDQVA